MNNERSIPLAIIFTIITCGIYGIYWYIVLTDETVRKTGYNQQMSGGMAFLFTLITCHIYSIYWSYKMGEAIDAANRRNNITSSNAVVYLLLSLFGFDIIVWALLQSEINRIPMVN